MDTFGQFYDRHTLTRHTGEFAATAKLVIDIKDVKAFNEIVQDSNSFPGNDFAYPVSGDALAQIKAL